jgi:hypothetical protein
VKYPLRVASWSCADADLQKPGWVNKLQEAGLDLQATTVSTHVASPECVPQDSIYCWF